MIPNFLSVRTKLASFCTIRVGLECWNDGILECWGISTAGNFVCFTQSASDWNAGLMEYSREGGNHQSQGSASDQSLPLPVGHVARIATKFCASTTLPRRVTPCVQRNKRFFARGVFCLFNCCTNRDHYFWRQAITDNSRRAAALRAPNHALPNPAGLLHWPRGAGPEPAQPARTQSRWAHHIHVIARSPPTKQSQFAGWWIASPGSQRHRGRIRQMTLRLPYLRSTLVNISPAAYVTFLPFGAL